MKLSLKSANLILSATMLSATLSTPALANTNNQVTTNQPTINTTLGETIKSVNGNTVTFNDDSKLIQKDGYYISKDSKGNDEYKIYKDDKDNVKYENLKTGEVKTVTTNTETYVESKEEQQRTDALIEKSQNKSTVMYAAGPPSGATNGYVYSRTENHSSEIGVATVAAAAGIIASIIGTPIAGIATTIATTYIGLKAKKVYWKTRIYSKKLSSTKLSLKYQYNFYKYHDYTGYLKTVTKYQTCQAYGCGPIQ